jgi:hypothetical protein
MVKRAGLGRLVINVKGKFLTTLLFCRRAIADMRGHNGVGFMSVYGIQIIPAKLAQHQTLGSQMH